MPGASELERKRQESEPDDTKGDWKAPEPIEMETMSSWLYRVVKSLEDWVNDRG